MKISQILNEFSEGAQPGVATTAAQTPQAQAAAQAIQKGLAVLQQQSPNFDASFNTTDAIQEIMPDGTVVMDSNLQPSALQNVRKILALGGGANFKVTMSTQTIPSATGQQVALQAKPGKVAEEYNQGSSEATAKQVYQYLIQKIPGFMYTAPTADVKKAISKAMSFGPQISVPDLASYAYGILKTNDLDEGDRPFRGVDGARYRDNDEQHDLDPTDWYIVKDGEMFLASIYPNDVQQAIAQGFSRTKAKAKAKDEAKLRDNSQGVAEGEGGLGQVAGIGINGKQFNFSIKDLIAKAQNYPIKKLNPQLFVKQLADRHEDPKQTAARAQSADLQYPIIVVQDGNTLMIADGTHRAQKAIMNKLPAINAHVIPVEDMAEFVKQGVAEAGNANSGRRGPDYQDNSPVVPGRVEHLPQGLRHHADASRYGGTEPDDEDDRLLGPQQRHRLHRAVTPDDLDEQEKIAGRHDPDDFDNMVGRLKKLAGAGPLKTVWDPAKRVYKNVPHAVQPAQQPKKAPQ